MKRQSLYPSKKDAVAMIACIVALVLIIVCSYGCAANCNTVMGKPAIWKSYEHAKCSMGKFDKQCANTEIEQVGWWGCKTEVVKR
jgi:hypothetical protein